MKKILLLTTLLSMTNLFAEFGTALEMSTSWNSTTYGELDAVTSTGSSIDLVELYYDGELKNGWSFAAALELQSAPVAWTSGYFKKEMENMFFRIGRISTLTDDDENERYYGFTIAPMITTLAPSGDGVEFGYSIAKNQTVVIQSHLETDRIGNFTTIMLGYRGELEDRAKWNFYYAKPTDGGDESSYGVDLSWVLNKLALSFDYKNFCPGSSSRTETSMILGAQYEMGAFTPYAHVAMETAPVMLSSTPEDFMTIDAGVKMNWGGPNYYLGANYITTDYDETKILTVAANLEYDFSL